jgi:hypothetical protein
MKYIITIVVEGGNELKNDLEHGHVESGIKQDVLPDEEILEFQFKRVEDESAKVNTCSYCGSGLFNERGDCQNCGL